MNQKTAPLIRSSIQEDAPHLTSWLLDPLILRWFPMVDEREVEDSVRIWMNYAKLGASLTAEIAGEPCGMAILYLQPFKKLAHQCLFAIIVSEKYRGKGVGTFLLKELKKMAKEKFHIELLHLEVYEGNPAINLYRRSGFKEYGRHTHFIKEREGQYISKILMEQLL